LLAGFCISGDRAYGAEDVAGISTDIAGSSLEASEAIEERIDDTAELTADSTDDIAEETSDDTGGAEDDGGASLELTAELGGSTGVTGVGVGRLKIQIRPTITTTATMMIIQVLRFIWSLPLLEETRPGGLSFCLDALPLPVCAASNFSSVVGGVEFRRSLCFFLVQGAAA
jgi:hypothetical protein